jgi:hypothetical protein
MPPPHPATLRVATRPVKGRDEEPLDIHALLLYRPATN